MREKQANRRIRLLLGFRARLRGDVRARRLAAGRQGGAPLEPRAEPARETQKIPAGRGTIFDRTGVQLAIGEQTTTVFADPQQVRNPRAVALAAHELLGVDANALYPAAAEQEEPVRLRRSASPTRRRPRCS